jgi:AbrB family looped-hinge helix DNA binding protein
MQGANIQTRAANVGTLVSTSFFPYIPFMKATVVSKGRITIPQAIRRKLKLHAGTVLEFDAAADHLKATKCVDRERMRAVIGFAKETLAGKDTEGWLDELRGPVKLPSGKRSSRIS